MPDGKHEHRLGSAVVIPERPPRRSKRYTDGHGDRHLEDEGRTRTSRDSRTHNYEQRNRFERRDDDDGRNDRTRGRFDTHFRRGSNRRPQPYFSGSSPYDQPDQRDQERPGTRYPSVMDLDPSDVPRSGKYFLHDNRESSGSPYRGRGTWRSRGRGFGDLRDRRRGRSPIWRHDKFEEIVERQDTAANDTGTAAVNESSTDTDFF